MIMWNIVYYCVYLYQCVRRVHHSRKYKKENSSKLKNIAKRNFAIRTIAINQVSCETTLYLFCVYAHLIVIRLALAVYKQHSNVVVFQHLFGKEKINIFIETLWYFYEYKAVAWAILPALHFSKNLNLVVKNYLTIHSLSFVGEGRV